MSTDPRQTDPEVGSDSSPKAPTGTDAGVHTDADTETWTILYDQQMTALPGRCRPEYFDTHDALGLRRDEIPTLEALGERMRALTGWTFVHVDGSLKSGDFFALTSQRRFPVSTGVRPRSELAHARLPDVFHDVFGHVPLLANPLYSDYLVRVSEVAVRHADEPATVRRLSRAVAWTVEYGLMGTLQQPRVYGAGLISSLRELDHVLGPTPTRHAFSARALLDTAHTPASLQREYFVVASFEQLCGSVDDFAALVG